MREPLYERVGDRWRDILPLLGVPAKFLNGRNQPCPVCGGRDRARFDNKEGRGTWFCSHCGAGDGVALVMKLKKISFREAAELIEPLIGEAKVPDAKPKAERSEAEKRSDMVELWEKAKPITPGCPAGLYITNRTGLKEYPASLRAVDSLKYWDDEKGIARFFPAMIAKVAGRDGKAANVYRTYLTKEGDKAPVDPPRRMMSGPVPKGCAVRLWGAAEAMGIAEGIETAISAALIHGVPVWAALGTSGLQSWDPPAGVKRVLIFGDCDRGFAGQAAAYALGYRLLAVREGDGRKYEVEVHIPGHVTNGLDWDDVRRSA